MTSDRQRERTARFNVEMAQQNIQAITENLTAAFHAFKAHAADGLDRPGGDGGITQKGSHSDPTARRALQPDEFDQRRQRVFTSARDLKYQTQALASEIAEIAAIPVQEPGRGQVKKCQNPLTCPDDEWAVHNLDPKTGLLALCGPCYRWKHEKNKHRPKRGIK